MHPLIHQHFVDRYLSPELFNEQFKSAKHWDNFVSHCITPIWDLEDMIQKDFVSRGMSYPLNQSAHACSPPASPFLHSFSLAHAHLEHELSHVPAGNTHPYYSRSLTEYSKTYLYPAPFMCMGKVVLDCTLFHVPLIPLAYVLPIIDRWPDHILQRALQTP